jgi:hypothetical protein
MQPDQWEKALNPYSFPDASRKRREANWLRMNAILWCLGGLVLGGMAAFMWAPAQSALLGVACIGFLIRGWWRFRQSADKRNEADREQYMHDLQLPEATEVVDPHVDYYFGKIVECRGPGLSWSRVRAEIMVRTDKGLDYEAILRNELHATAEVRARLRVEVNENRKEMIQSWLDDRVPVLYGLLAHVQKTYDDYANNHDRIVRTAERLKNNNAESLNHQLTNAAINTAPSVSKSATL